MHLIRHTPPTRAILPNDIRAFYARARAATYAAGTAVVPHPTLPHAKELPFEAPPLFYCDRYFDTPARPGNFFGIETVHQGAPDGPVVASCSYGGGFTDAGLNLPPGADLGDVLKAMLREYAALVRFGDSVQAELRVEAGQWRYEDAGDVLDWGWQGTERIWLDDTLVYSLGYQGGCLLPNY